MVVQSMCHREGQSPVAISCLSLDELIYLTKRKKRKRKKRKRKMKLMMREERKIV